METKYDYLRGKIHDFGDGTKLHVIDVKQREETAWVTYENQQPYAIPKRFSLKAEEFIHQFGHLFQND